MINRLPVKEIGLFLDLKPALDKEMLDKRLLRDFDKYKNKQAANALTELLPQKMISAVLKASGVDAKKNVNVLTKAERERILGALNGFPMMIAALRRIRRGDRHIQGGVALTEIDPKSMRAKKIEGLRFCGEVLDVDAFTGGFNLQIAFSTGFAAGKSIK